MFFGITTAHAQVRGLSYTLSPVGEQIFFGDNAGMERGFVYGGEVGFGFGRLVELHAVYLRNDGLSTDFGTVSGITEETRELLVGLPSRSVNMQRYGGKLRLNAPIENVVPFGFVGAGIVRLEPEHLNPTRTIYLGAGAGVQFAFGGRYALALSAERFSYRYNLGSTFFDGLDLADLGLAPESFNQIDVNNWAYRAGLQIYVGGRAPGEETSLDRALREQISGGFRGLSLRFEPAVSTLAFHEDLGFRGDQRFVGLYAGLNLGPYVGARAFYWRALEQGGLNLEALQAYGGEVRFELGVSQSLAPYLMAGGGYMDVLEGYVGREGRTPGDEPFVLVGAGASLPLSESLSLNASARSVLMGEEGVDNVDDPGQVRSSWMYSAGLNFAFGRSTTTASSAFETAMDRGDAELRDELQRSEARIDSLARVLDRLQLGVPAAASSDSVAAGQLVTEEGRRAPAREPRMVTLPLPEEGELYIRFGRPGGVSIETVTEDGEVVRSPGNAAGLTSDQIDEIVRATVREQLGGSGDAAVTNEQIVRIEQMLDQRLDAMEERLQAQIESDRQRFERQTTPSTVVIDRSGSSASTRSSGPRAVKPFTGAMFGTPDMGVVGFRLDMDASLLGPIDLQPEFALGFGAGTYAYHVSVDAIYDLTFMQRSLGGALPYVGLGGGMLGFNDSPADTPGVQLTVNSRIGADFDLPWGRFFGEYAAYDAFTFNRIVLGYRFGL